MKGQFLSLPEGPITNLSPYLPGLLRLKNDPMSLDDYFVFKPVFSTVLPPNLTFEAGRQLGKTRSTMGRLIVEMALVPGREILVVLPLQEQSDTLSSVIFKPMMEDSPVGTLLAGDATAGSVRRREFSNRSMIQFSYAFLDATRVRSKTAQWLYLDESVLGDTYVSTVYNSDIKQVKIKDIKIGDTVISVDEKGNQHVDTVKYKSHHGLRHCYRIKLADGSSVGCTSNSWIATDKGWRQLSTIIENINSNKSIKGNNKNLRLTNIPGINRVRNYEQLNNEETNLIKIICDSDFISKLSKTTYNVITISNLIDKYKKEKIIGIEYIGQHIVFDIETEKYKNFICNGGILIHNCQDMDGAHIPIIKECLGSAKNPIVWVTGTSKTKDTVLAKSYESSSQAVWITKCEACGFENIAKLEPEGHLLAMIGPYRDDISEKSPGTICAKCKACINPRYGFWRHRLPERMRDHVGYHIPQVIMPGHYANPIKWKLLLSKMNGGEGYTQAKFYNEVLGEPFDMAFKLVSIDDLKAAAKGLGPNNLENSKSRSPRYQFRVLGVDWGGGGENGVSRTKVAMCGLASDRKAEVYFGLQFPPSTDRVAEGREICKLATMFNANIIAHDYNGTGTSSEAVLTHLGWPIDRIAPMRYAGTIGDDMIKYHPPGKFQTRGYYTMDKARGLQFLAMAIRQNMVKFFDYDYIDQDRPGLLHDFLALVEDTVDTPSGSIYRIRKGSPHDSDDFASAVHYGLAALWEYTSSWPQLK